MRFKMQIKTCKNAIIWKSYKCDEKKKKDWETCVMRNKTKTRTPGETSHN